MEIIARSLFCELENHFSNSPYSPKIELEGAGVHWTCDITLKNHSISTYSCDLSYHKGATESEEFIVSFFEDGEVKCCGRTYLRNDVLESAEAWLINPKIDQIYMRFEYVDRGLREVRRVQASWLTHYPELEKATRVIDNYGSGVINYSISHGERLCRFSTSGEDEKLHITFEWNACKLFTVQMIPVETAEVLKLFLMDLKKPSVIRKRFPWMPTNELSEAHEEGRGLEGECIYSWKNILRFYDEFPTQPWLDKDKILSFIHSIINEGYDKSLRASVSVARLILSPPNVHGVSDNKPFIAFTFQNDTVSVLTSFKEEEFIEELKLNEKILNLVDRLSKEPI